MKAITFIFRVIGIIVVLFFAFIYYLFKDFPSGGIGIDHNIAYENKAFDTYRLELQKANKTFLESDDPYYFFELELKEHIVGECVDRYFKDHNISDAKGWRFPLNISLRYRQQNHSSDLYDKKYSKSLRLLEKKGFKHLGFQHTWKIDKEVDCNKTLKQNLHSYLAKSIFFYSHDFEHKNLQWAEYLRKHITDDCYVTLNDEPIKCIDYVKKKKEEKSINIENMKKKAKLKEIIKKQNDLWRSAETGSIYGMDYFNDVDANVRNENGETPLIIAVRNGYSAVVDFMHGAIVDVHMKDNKGKTAFDYIKQPSSRHEKIFSDRMYGSLRVLEVAQVVRGKGKIVQYTYRNDTDILKVLIVGAECSDFVFPENTQCKTGK